jgi:hypothetical protein
MLNCAVSGDILKKDFRLMTFWKMQRCSTGTARDEASSYLTKEFLRSVSAGIGSQKGALRSLVREQAQAVKDANPCILPVPLSALAFPA